MIKAIFFDIDGTLLSYNSHNVSASTVEACAELKQKGVRIFVSSGRPMVLIPDMPISFDGYVTVNGGYCFVGDEVVMRKPIDSGDCKRWLEYVQKEGKTTMCFTEKEMYINKIDPITQALRDQLGFTMPPIRPLEEMCGKEVFQFIAIQPKEEDEKILEMLPHCRMPRWHSVFTDVIPTGSSKAEGIEQILNHFGLKREESMAFGDGENDIEMLDYVGCSVAMGNAADIVKQHANYVTEDADHDGIANELNRLGIL